MHGMMKNMPSNKEKVDKTSFKKLILYCKPFYVLMIISFICAIGGSICTIYGPQKIQDLVTEISSGIMTGINLTSVRNIAILLLCIYVGGAILSYIQQFLMATVTQKVSRNLRNDINKKINELPLSYFDKNSKGDILSRVTNDVDTIGQTLGQSIASLLSAVVLFFGVIIMMFYTNWLLALVTIATSLFGFLFMVIILKTSQKYFYNKQVSLGKINGQIEEIYTNHNIVKAFNAKDNEDNKFKKFNNELYDSNWKSQFLSGLMMPIMSFIGNLSYLLIFIVGVACIINGNKAVGLGTLLSFTIYARLFSQPLSTFAQSMTSIQQASAASKRVFELLEEPSMLNEDNKTKRIEKVEGNIEFKNVSFRYLPEKPIINNFSASIKKGQKIAIVGPTGAGKTTIVNLLMRFYDINGGDILIDGVSINDMKREDVHDLFDMILQDTWLFKGTIKENLVFNKENVTTKQLDEACDAVGLHHLIETLPNGYDTELSDSTNLSEGQKQQLTIARALIKDAPLLILDEATSNVDTRTELVIQNAMDKLTEGRTSFVIAHRLSTIKNADLILVLNHGDIVEMGNHDELLKAKGFYADLYNSQFQTIE